MYCRTGSYPKLLCLLFERFVSVIFLHPHVLYSYFPLICLYCSTWIDKKYLITFLLTEYKSASVYQYDAYPQRNTGRLQPICVVI